MTDDGFNLGVLYARSRVPALHGSGPARATVADLEQGVPAVTTRPPR